MSSKAEGEFLASFASILVAAAAVCVLLLALFLAPVFAVAGVPIAAYFYWRNSPKQKEKEVRERTEALYQKAIALVPPPVEEHIERLIATLDEPPFTTAHAIYQMEGLEPPPPVPPVCDSIEGARYRDRLLAYIDTIYDPKRKDEFVDALIDCMPTYARGEGIFKATASLTNEEIEQLITPFYGYPDYFRSLKKQLDRNLLAQKSVLPSEYKGDNCAFAYLKDTPLLDLEKRTFNVGLKARTEHTQIVAASGSGKTSLLEYMIHHDLDPAEDCCVVVIDSQQQLIDKLAHRSLWTGDVAYFSPRHRLGINIFDVEATGEEDVIAVLDLMEYVLSGLMDAKLTSKQETLFSNAVQLMMAVPGANLDSMRRLLRKNGLLEFVHYITKLPPAAQDFFENEFSQQGYNSTKEEIMWRLDALQRNPAFARIFSATKNPVDMAEEMADRKLILIDTDVNLLGDRGSSFFGRFFIALILKAARQRFSGHHKPVYVYIDECAAYLDSRLELMLQQARKANIGVILAHQDLDKARSASILTTILGNTATKFAGRLSDSDARVMAANMKTTPDFLQALPRYHFGYHTIGERTLAVSAETGRLAQAEERDNYDDLIEEMEERYGNAPKATPPEEPEPEADPEEPSPLPPPPKAQSSKDYRPDVVDAKFEPLPDDDDLKPGTTL